MNNSQIQQVFGINEIDITLFWAFKCDVTWYGISGEANFISDPSLNCHFIQILPPWVISLPPKNTFTIIKSLKLRKTNCWKNSIFFALKNQNCLLRNYPSPDLKSDCLKIKHKFF